MIRTEYFTDTRRPEYNRAVAGFVSRLCFGNADGFEKYSSMGVFDNDTLIAGTVFHNWHDGAGVMELSSAAISRRWLSPRVIRAMMAFPFDVMGCQMVAMRVSERNSTMVRIAKRFGFEGVMIPRLRGRDESEWVFTMTDDAWRDHPICNRGKPV